MINKLAGKKCCFFLLLLFWAGSGLTTVNAGAPVSGVAASFTSPNGVSEQCIEITPMPKAHYSKKDRKNPV